MLFWVGTLVLGGLSFAANASVFSASVPGPVPTPVPVASQPNRCAAHAQAPPVVQNFKFEPPYQDIGLPGITLMRDGPQTEVIHSLPTLDQSDVIAFEFGQFQLLGDALSPFSTESHGDSHQPSAIALLEVGMQGWLARKFKGLKLGANGPRITYVDAFLPNGPARDGFGAMASPIDDIRPRKKSSASPYSTRARPDECGQIFEALQALAAIPNAQFVTGTASRAPGIEDASQDRVFWRAKWDEKTPQSVAAAFAEIVRILKPGGVAHVFLRVRESRVSWAETPQLMLSGLRIAGVQRSLFDGARPGSLQQIESDLNTAYGARATFVFEAKSGHPGGDVYGGIQITIRKN